MDTKNKELVGEFGKRRSGVAAQGRARAVRVHDFVDRGLGRAVPYGDYDLANDEGWVSVGESADTAEFAANAIASWWSGMGAGRFPSATRLLITADAGGSNGYRLGVRTCRLYEHPTNRQRAPTRT